MRAPVLLAVLALLVAAPGVARAQVIVTTTHDHDDGACTPADCTLREAVRLAQPEVPIQLGNAMYQLTGGELKSDTEEVSIVGRGARATIIDGNNQTRLLNVRDGSVSVTGVRFTRGNAQPGGSDLFARTADVPAGDGGAIAVQAGADLTLRASTVDNNRATLTDGGDGGGIASEGVLRIFYSLIAGNQASGEGGGIAVAGAGSLRIDSSTISSNTAVGNGGGIHAGAETTVRFTTIAGNQAAAGGGVYRPEGGIPGAAHGSLLAGNRLTGGAPSACGGALEPPLTTSYNVVADGVCVLNGPGNQFVENAQLEPLANNGGPTNTHALRPGSPAIDNGGDECEEDVDQRGLLRPRGAGCDVGALETAHQPFEPVGRIAGRPIDVFADGLGQLQVRFNDDPRGAFEPRPNSEAAIAGLVLIEGDEIYYPIAGDNHGYQFPLGERTTISGPRMITRGDERVLLSEYYLGERLRVTENVVYEDGEREFRVSYRIENVSTSSVRFRAGQLASLGVRGVGARTDGSIGVIASNGGSYVGLEEVTPWRAAQVGADDNNDDVFEAFPSGLEGGQPIGSGKDEIGAEWPGKTLEPGLAETYEVGWRIAEATQEVTVNTTADTVVGACEAPPGDCTLREALQLAPPGAVIRVPAGEYNLVTGQLQVTQDRVVRGAGARSTIIRAASNSRVLVVDDASLGLSGVTITGGAPPVPQVGGGIMAGGDALALADSAVTGNRADAGGGIAGSGAISIVRSAISGNTTVDTTVDVSGAGILALFARLWVINSTISGNRAEGAEVSGGGIATEGTARLVNSTITANTAPQGAGLVRVGTPDNPPEDQFFADEVRATIIAGNFGGSQCAGRSLPRSSHSLAGDASCLLSGEDDAENVADPRLGPLLNNGGETNTHALLAGSPARDAGGDGVCATTDQRGEERPSGHACDVGAYEDGQLVLPPSRPEFTTPAEGTVLASADVQVTGSTTAGAAVLLTLDGQPRQELNANQDGVFSVLLRNVADGRHVVTATAADGGGTSPESAPRSFTVDTRTDTPAVGGPDVVQSGEFTLSGQAEPGAVVTIFEGETPLGTTTAGPNGAWAFTVSGAAPGEHTYYAVARDSAGNVSPRSAVRTVRVSPAVVPAQTPTPTPTPTPEPDLPPPVVAQSVNAEVKSGTVRIQLRGSNRFIELEAGRQIPMGSTIDTRNGRVTLTSADGSGGTQTADFYDGIFRVTQTRGPRPITVLTLTERLSCPRGRASAAQGGKKTRKLWGDGRGRFRTVGRYSAATVRGTVWLTQDRCESTLIRVTQGSVTVRDLVKRKNLIVRRGGRYTARANRR